MWVIGHDRTVMIAVLGMASDVITLLEGQELLTAA
jgi:hypothetical protein